MRCYCQSPIECHCDGVDGTMTEVEARIAILEERKRLSGTDAAVDALIEKLTKPQGRVCCTWISRKRPLRTCRCGSKVGGSRGRKGL